MRISASCYSDDREHECKFDAIAWFVQASDEDVLALASCGWGNYAADCVAEFMEESSGHANIKSMFRHIRRYNAEHQKTDGDVCGFECHVDEDEALAWLQTKRPALFERIDCA